MTAGAALPIAEQLTAIGLPVPVIPSAVEAAGMVLISPNRWCKAFALAD
jgi:hypothetical protein